MLLVTFCSKKSFVSLNPFCWLASICLFFFLSSNSKFVFLSSSDEVVTAAQHLYEMVSFYFDDLGKPLFVDIMTPLYSSLSFVRLLYFIVILSFQIRSPRHPAGVHSDL